MLENGENKIIIKFILVGRGGGTYEQHFSIFNCEQS
jgi:hypothetical protein